MRRNKAQGLAALTHRTFGAHFHQIGLGFEVFTFQLVEQDNFFGDLPNAGFGPVRAPNGHQTQNRDVERKWEVANDNRMANKTAAKDFLNGVARLPSGVFGHFHPMILRVFGRRAIWHCASGVFLQFAGIRHNGFARDQVKGH